MCDRCEIIAKLSSAVVDVLASEGDKSPEVMALVDAANVVINDHWAPVEEDGGYELAEEEQEPSNVIPLFRLN